ncbi:hypothetical protein BH11BAC3_BH11BAC3_43740 [soil metagenome]
MKQIFALAVIVLLLNSCNNNTIEPTTTPVAAEEKIMAPEHNCYAYISAKDTVKMHLQMSGNIVTGDLAYHYFEKDKNTGTIQGSMKGDTLYADYKFMSEGAESTREVVFLKTANDFVEGYGDSEEKNGKMVFKNTGSLNFNNKLILKNVACEK